eukprot:4449405-Amphidinium_carterae.1
MKDAWGSLGRCGTNHREVRWRIAQRLRTLLISTPTFLGSCTNVLGESGALEPNEKHIKLFKRE